MEFLTIVCVLSTILWDIYRLNMNLHVLNVGVSLGRLLLGLLKHP